MSTNISNQHATSQTTTDLIDRAQAAHLKFPQCVIGGWAALHYAGLKLETQNAPLTLISRGRHHRRQDNIYFLEPPKDLRIWRPDIEYHSLKASTIAHATVDCLQLLEKRRHEWWVPAIPGLTFTEIRQVQLLDELRKLRLFEEDRLILAAEHRFSSKQLSKLITLSASGAQSPRETCLRLILKDIPGLETQVKFYDPNDLLLTAADCAVPQLKVAAFYDGEDHLARHQRDHDAKAWALLDQMGWRMLRVTSGMLSDPAWIQAHFQQLIAEARAERATKFSRMIRRTKAKPEELYV